MKKKFLSLMMIPFMALPLFACGEPPKDGVDGRDGLDGKDGKDGLSAYELYIKQYPGYTWGEEQWLIDLARGNLSVDVSFETFGGEAIAPIEAAKGQEITITQEAVRENSTFSGWYVDAELTQAAEATFIAEKTSTLYAKYVNANGNVTFYVDGAAYHSYESETWVPVTFPSAPSKLGYRFAGWKTSDGTPFESGSLLRTSTLNLYASFEYDFLELPAIVINVDDGSGITDKETYKKSKISVLNAKEEYCFEGVSAGVRGRGNSTWTMPKKPYRIKFDKKQSMFGTEYKAKSWTLLANYVDKSLLRNYVTYDFAENIGEFPFVSVHQPVDLYLNGSYEGVYLLCDQIQAGEGRVEIDEEIAEDGNNGFLIERDGRAPSEGVLDQDYFIFQGGEYAIKSPDTEAEDYLAKKEIEIAYIKNYFQQCWDAISTGTWEEVKALVDIDSFVNMYIVDEIMESVDVGWSSSYFTKQKDGPLMRGPLWDYDLSSGNVNYGPGDKTRCIPENGLFAGGVDSWYAHLRSRTEFQDAVRARLSKKAFAFSKTLSLIDPKKNNLYKQYRGAFERNFVKWEIMGMHVLHQPDEVTNIVTVKGQVDYLHDWLLARYKFVYESYTGEDFILP